MNVGVSKMKITDLMNKFKAFDSGETVRSWTKDPKMICYENEYMKCVRIDSANKHIPNNKMIKQWSILFEKKKDFSSLPAYKELKANMNVKITPVTRGELKGFWGLRIYNVHQEPKYEMIKDILDFIFS